MATKSRNGASLSRWQARKLHTVTGQSGQRLRIELLGVAGLLQAGALPEDLIELALMELTEKGGATAVLAERLADAPESGEERQRALDMIARYGDLQKRLAIAAIREIEVERDIWQHVELTIEDVPSLPEDDLAMVAEIVQRLRAHDAVGVRIGVEPLDRWATFCESHRGIPCTCDADCEGCQKLVAALSSADVGGV